MNVAFGLDSAGWGRGWRPDWTFSFNVGALAGRSEPLFPHLQNGNDTPSTELNKMMCAKQLTHNRSSVFVILVFYLSLGSGEMALLPRQLASPLAYNSLGLFLVQ